MSLLHVCVCASVRVRVRGGYKRAGVCLRMFSILPWVAFSHVTVDVSWHRTQCSDSDDTEKLHVKKDAVKVETFAAVVSPLLKLKELFFLDINNEACLNLRLYFLTFAVSGLVMSRLKIFFQHQVFQQTT